MKEFIQRLLLVNITGASLLSIYLLINRLDERGHIELEMPAWVPFWPGMALPYLMMLILPVFLQMLIQDRRRFLQSLLSVIIAFTATAIIWILFPTEMIRPPLDAQSHISIYQFMIRVDRPVNIFPCGHVLWPISVLFFLTKEHRNWLRILLPLFLVGTVTIVTTWQHRPFDVLTGIGLSLGSIWLATRVRWRTIHSDS
ncbi:MAG: hypothetical protein P1U90_04700 [Akkermansiaceae bacterium]|nr:hypothetical protein [Akkermansiaceae bacterium]